MNLRSIKLVVVFLAKYLGGFKLAEHLTRKGVRILCYHGTSVEDGYKWRPMLFMRPETFQQRMRYLAESGVNIVPLSEAVAMLAAGKIERNTVAVTFDDGFALTFSEAVPVLSALGIPATIYVTSYYAMKQTPIFRLALQYMAWKVPGRILDLEKLGVPSDGTDREYSEMDSVQESVWRTIEYGERLLDEPGRVELARNVAEQLEFNYGKPVIQKMLALVSTDQLQNLSDPGIDIQLHTHRHVLPLERAAAIREIAENRSALQPYVERELVHFCYPSGRWDEQHKHWLREAGIESATTTDCGLNYPGHSLLSLTRFLDSDEISQLEFEAELSGFTELLRRMFK